MLIDYNHPLLFELLLWNQTRVPTERMESENELRANKAS